MEYECAKGAYISGQSVRPVLAWEVGASVSIVVVRTYDMCAPCAGFRCDVRAACSVYMCWRVDAES